MKLRVKSTGTDKGPLKGILTDEQPDSKGVGIPILIPDGDGFHTANSLNLKGMVLICTQDEAIGKDNLIERAREIGFSLRIEG